ncbi:MAG: YifB family Mg chelatase-like AAA ATPase, partial [Spirochaetales bacterium]|nr:YifB family Mg chelatase-like AAA ATPase [Spirochaetales bacterium]
LRRSGELGEVESETLALGELQLSGKLRPVRGVLSAVAAAMEDGIRHVVVPRENAREARALDYGIVRGVTSLRQAALAMCGSNAAPDGGRDAGDRGSDENAAPEGNGAGDFSEIRGHANVKRALAIAAAGGHHALLFGPPGSGKTLAAQRVAGILPRLSTERSIEVTRIHSLAGLLGGNGGLIQRPPVRCPHHSATVEGVVGGGHAIRPGEISLAHGGVLILDEVPEFRRDLLQSLREPMESGRVEIARAGMVCWFPADFQLVLTANPCPCGNLGRDEAVCVCSRYEIERYWKKLGGALLDRIDLRIPVKPVPARQLLCNPTASSGELRTLVGRAREAQKKRAAEGVATLNGKLKPDEILKYCALDEKTAAAFEQAMRKVSLSSRACHSILRVARTIADMERAELIRATDLYEAIQLRRYGEGEFFF